jgi:hypothetical protein
MPTILFTAGAKGGTGKSTAARFLIVSGKPGTSTGSFQNAISWKHEK